MVQEAVGSSVSATSASERPSRCRKFRLAASSCSVDASTLQNKVVSLQRRAQCSLDSASMYILKNLKGRVI